MNLFIKLFEKLIDFWNYIRIMISPILISAFVGLIIYANKTDLVGLGIAILITICGCIVGVLLANWAKRNGGTTEFMGKVHASPDIDDAVKNDNDSKH